ncbi:phosphotransferase family protein [Bacterioplanes sanyensis]|uniref:Phosphotransferase family protein n=2 Tax=Bacterioplanes sanyensis TaxID=1249553 RepID=A0A222FQZ9_9GAMM|nr:phosphotransferase family protein [Bacterioplanes sanyensis]
MSEQFVDQAKTLRDSDAFDLQAVHDWLNAQGFDYGSQLPQIKQFSGGASNLTYHLLYSPDYANNDLILRRPPAGHKAASAHDMRREFNVMQRLKPVYPYAPDMIAFCDDASVIGGDFYLMQRLRGIIPRGNLPKGMLLSKEQARSLCYSVIDKLIDLHQVDYQAAGLQDLGKGQGYVKRQVEGWSQRYIKSKTWNVPGFKRIMTWLQQQQPEDVSTCIIHNDYRMDNLVLNADNPGEIIGVLDWEMATLGDPLMDLGGALAYWVQADDDRLMRMIRRQPSHLPGMLTREEIVDYYCEKMGFDRSHWPFYEVFGLFRLAVIVQQIYYRYHHKQTDNPAFKHFWLFVHYLHYRCQRVIKHSGIK